MALLIAIVTTSFSGLLLFFQERIFTDLNVTFKLLGLLIILISNFFVFRYILKIAIFRRVDLIYRQIRGAQYVELDFNENTSLDKVNTEVANWAFNTKEEIKNLKSLSHYRKEFVGNVSHELKTPIFSMQGYLHTLIEGGIHDEDINVYYLQKALYNLERLELIVKDLDTINQLESNIDAIQISSFDVKSQVSKVFRELEKVAYDAKISLNFGKGEEANIMVKGDENRINQVFYNLIINSIKYGTENGKTIVSFYNMDDHYVIEVRDNGIGIDEKHLKHLFDRFYRVDSSRSRSLGGSGLGLSIVKHIIESHNQSISVNSTLGIGTTFTFTLDKD